MNFSEKCRLLADFYYYYRYLESWSGFARLNDIGLPLAWLIDIGQAEPTDSGTQWINDTWDRFCLFVGVDKDAHYDSLSTLFDQATKVDHV